MIYGPLIAIMKTDKPDRRYHMKSKHATKEDNSTIISDEIQTSEHNKIHIVCLFIIGLIIGSAYHFTQPTAIYKNGLVYEAVEYRKMILQSAEKKTLSARKPFVYRSFLPILAGTTCRITKIDPQQIIMTYNFIFGLAGYLFFVMLCLKIIQNRALVYILGILYLSNYFVPFRFGTFYPFYVDPPAAFFSVLLLYLHCKWDRLTPLRLGFASILALLGVWTREYVLVSVLASTAAHRVLFFPDKKHIVKITEPTQFALGFIPVITAIITLIIVHKSVIPTPASQEYTYTFLGHALFSINYKLWNPHNLLIPAFVCYGPFLLTGLLLNRRTLRNILDHPMLLLFGIGIFILAVLGGSHTERFFFWGAPAYLPFLGLMLLDENNSIPKNTIIVLCVILLLQLIATRAFFPLPNARGLVANSIPEFLFLAPYGKNIHYFHIWTYEMPASTKKILLLEYFFLIVPVLGFRFFIRMRRFNSCQSPHTGR